MKSLQSKAYAAAGLLLVFMGVIAGGAARKESVTVDELAHIGAGVSYLQKLDMRMNEEHPPLAKALAALPLVMHGARADYSSVPWNFSEKLFNQFLGEWSFGNMFLMHWNDPFSTLWWARIPMLTMTLLLGLTIYICGTKLGGSHWAGLLCLSAFATMPPFLAFGPLVITDVIVTLFWILAVWQLPQMWRAPGRKQVLMLGLALAGAFLSKFSSGLMFFVFPAVALSLRLWPLPDQPTEKAESRIWRRRAWRNIAKATLWAALLVYIVYLVLSWNQSTDSFSLIPHFPASHLLRRILMPLWLYLRGLVFFALSAGSRPTYILGHAYPHGVWFYFPMLFFLKSPLPFLLLLLLAVTLGIVIKARQMPDSSAIPVGMELNWRCLWISLVVFTTACLLNRLDISIRHFLVPLALIILLLAPLPRMLDLLRRSNRSAARIGTWSTVALVLAAIIIAINTYPNFLPFINVLGMARPGYLLVNDSNLDWNQALVRVERFVIRRGIKHVLLDQYGFSEPEAYVPEAQIWDCQKPSAGDADQWAVVSANLIADGSNCRWLFRYLHLEIADGSMYAFRLPDVIPPAGEIGGPPLPKDYRYFGGIQVQGTDPKTIFLACARDPNQLQPTMDRLRAEMERQRNKK